MKKILFLLMGLILAFTAFSRDAFADDEDNMLMELRSEDDRMYSFEDYSRAEVSLQSRLDDMSEVDSWYTIDRGVLEIMASAGSSYSDCYFQCLSILFDDQSFDVNPINGRSNVSPAMHCAGSCISRPTRKIYDGIDERDRAQERLDQAREDFKRLQEEARQEAAAAAREKTEAAARERARAMPCSSMGLPKKKPSLTAPAPILWDDLDEESQEAWKSTEDALDNFDGGRSQDDYQEGSNSDEPE